MYNQEISIETLKQNYFDDIQATSKNLILKFKSRGRRYNLYIGDDKYLKLNEYGEVFKLSVGETLKLMTRDAKLIFSPLPDEIKPYGFYLREILQLRHMKNRFVTIEAYLLLLNTKSDRKGSDLPLRQEDIVIIQPSLDDAKKLLNK